MYPVQRFAVEAIYCAPSQDQQFTYKLVKVTKDGMPVKQRVSVYNTLKPLPDSSSYYHVYTLGGLPPGMLNLLGQNRDWYRDTWVKFQDDMTARDYIAQLYGEDGVNYLRSEAYYSFIDQQGLLIAVRITDQIKRRFNPENIKYLRVYSNNYFSGSDYRALPVQLGIICETFLVTNNADKVQIQTKLRGYETNGGKTMVYVNGYLTSNVNLNIPDQSIIETVYDQSIVSQEFYPLADLKTFVSSMDNKIKYLLVRDRQVDHIQYQDDVEFYLSDKDTLVTTGIYLYKHQEDSVRNVTDKDYSLLTDTVITSSNALTGKVGGYLKDKQLIVFGRLSADKRPVAFSTLKLNELYKLPPARQTEVLLGTNNTIPEYRASTLEASDYFKIASAKGVRYLTKELTSDALGYNGIVYQFGMSPVKSSVEESTVTVPELYQTRSTAHEYNEDGHLVGRYPVTGASYKKTYSNTKMIEFIKARGASGYTRLYDHNETIPVRNTELRVLSASFEGVNRLTVWEDITDNKNLVTKTETTVIVSESYSKKVKIVYLDECVLFDLDVLTSDGVLSFPLTVIEDRGVGPYNHKLDIPYLNIDVWLNGRHLAYNIDYFIQFPYISICNKTYLDYNQDYQRIFVRCHGFTTNVNDINKNVITGFVNNGVLTRNKQYDVRDDRVYTVHVGGRIQDKDDLRFAEDDNTVRLTDPLNGLPYSMAEPFIPFKEMTGLDTLPYYAKYQAATKRIADLYNLIFPEPAINPFNIIGDHHYLFSPTVAKIIHDLLNNVIPPSLYTTPYDDSTILKLLNDQYSLLLHLDPVKKNLPSNLVEIHPHFGNNEIAVNLHQYRFLTNVVRVITNNNSKKINLSGYLCLSSTT